jgi:hypothetical protein
VRSRKNLTTEDTEKKEERKNPEKSTEVFLSLSQVFLCVLCG